MIRPKHDTRFPIWKQLAFALGWGLGSFAVLFLLVNFAITLVFTGRIFPGVTMNGTSLAGMSVDEAASVISSICRYPDEGNILLVDGERTWFLKPVQLGFYLDPVASANAAYNLGRKGRLFDVLLDRVNLFTKGVETQPSFVFDQKTAISYLTTLANEINQTVREASLAIYGTEVVVQNGQRGRVLDVASTLQTVTSQIQSMQDGVIPLVILQSDPVVQNADTQAELARSILSQPLTLTVPGEGGNSIQLNPVDLAPLLSIERVQDASGAQYHITTNKPLLTAWLTSLADGFELTAENARFRFKDETHQLDLINPAVIGRTLDVEKTISAIDVALESGGHSAELQFVFTNPAVTDQMTGADLGITELVEEQYTYFAGSDSGRIQNIQTAASKFDGLLVAPGATLSMAEVLGDISVENDYTEALIIVGDETIKGVGGGVCQVSTTLFRTVLYSGFPVLERHPHAYRVGYYEQSNSSGARDSSLAGMDASVFVPLVDFKFTNDTPYWLLMETYVYPSSNALLWRFYSTSDGREVSVTSSGLSNIKEPLETVYRENPSFPEGKIKQVDWAVEGADVTITRRVTRNGTLLFEDRFFTRYEAWGDVFEYGPGTENIPTPTPTP